jgi:hypothetical protein
VPFEDGPPYAQAEDFLALAKYKQVYLKVTPINVSPKSWGKGSPQTLFGKVIERFGADRIAWGSNFPNSVGTLKEILAAARNAFSFAKASDKDWIFSARPRRSSIRRGPREGPPAHGPADRAVDQVRAGHQPPDRPDARPHGSVDAARNR